MSAHNAPRSAARAGNCGFTLIEVLVALVIVAFGMGAVLAALSNSALNVSALREKTLAQWVALNQVADTRLNLQAPQTGTTEGDVKGFGNADWHWQQIVSNVQGIPGLQQITVKVRRNKPSGTNSNGSGGSTSSTASASTQQSDWVTTVIGFRGNALAPSSGETPTWSVSVPTGAGGSSSSSSSGGTVPNPGTTTPGTGSSSSGSGSTFGTGLSAPGSLINSGSSSGGP